jgi:thioredoxin 1
MSLILLNDDTFDDEVISSDLPVLVEFWAEWCEPCQAMAPALERIAADYQGNLKVCKLNVDENPTVTARFSVASIPTLMLFKEGQALESAVGIRPREEIERMILMHLGEG